MFWLNKRIPNTPTVESKALAANAALFRRMVSHLRVISEEVLFGGSSRLSSFVIVSIWVVGIS